MLRFVPDKGVSENLELAGVGFTARAAEGIDRRANTDIFKTTVLHHLPPACTRHATGNSSGPKIDVADSFLRHRLAIGDVGELQHAARAQDTPDFTKDVFLVGA